MPNSGKSNFNITDNCPTLYLNNVRKFQMFFYAEEIRLFIFNSGSLCGNTIFISVPDGYRPQENIEELCQTFGESSRKINLATLPNKDYTLDEILNIFKS